MTEAAAPSADSEVEAEGGFKFYEYNDDLTRRGLGGDGRAQILTPKGEWVFITYPVNLMYDLYPISEEQAAKMAGDPAVLTKPRVDKPKADKTAEATDKTPKGEADDTDA